jgi:hypothetical protein
MNKKLKAVIRKNQYRSQFYQQHKPKKVEKKNDKEESKNSFLVLMINRILISALLFLVLLISKKDQKLNFIYDKTLRNMNFMQIKVFMDEKFNGLFPKTDDDYKYVDSITININNTNNYKEGIMIETNYSEPVLSCVDGIVISIYQDNELGDVIVIQDRNGLEYHYGNLANIDVKIYHSISRGQILGVGRITAEMNGEYYLAIKDGNKVLNVIEVVNS